MDKLFCWNRVIIGVCSALFGLVSESMGQDNLIPNGDFEKRSGCPQGQLLASIQLTEYWESCNGSPNYFHECNSQVSPAHNVVGFEPARSDSAVAGLAVYSEQIVNGHESLMARLAEPLIQSEEYYFEVYVSLADSCNFATGEFAAFFSTDSPEINQNDPWPPFTPQVVNNPVLNPLTSKEGWQKVSGVFNAVGGEEWVAVGVFFHDDDLTTTRVSNNQSSNYNWDYSYYYIDDALLLPLDVWLSVEEGERSGFSVYPNPARNTLTVEGKQNLSEVWLTDMRGKRLRAFYSVGGKWQTDVSDLPTGIYLVRCVSENGHLSTKKVVVN